MKRNLLLRERASARARVWQVGQYCAGPSNVVARSRGRWLCSSYPLFSFKSPRNLGIGLSGRYSYRKLF